MTTNLLFIKHINNLCYKARERERDRDRDRDRERERERAFPRKRKFLSQEQTKGLSVPYIISTFKYCPLMWMFCGKTDNKSISKIHKRNLQLIYDMEDATLQDLLERDYLQIIYEDNIHTLLAEVYKSIYYISPPITWILADTAGTQALCFKESLVWNKIPNKVFFNENKIFLENQN